MLRPAILFCCLVMTLVAAPSRANGPNLLQNPGFDSDLTAWTPPARFPAAWFPSDARGSVHSGSGKVVNNLPTPFADGLSQCVAVLGGTSYLLGASVWAEVGDRVDMEQHGVVEVTYYADSRCAPASEILTYPCGDATCTPSRSVFSHDFRHWEEISDLTVAPPAALSARIGLRPSKAGEPGFPFPLDLTTYFDNVYFGTAACSPHSSDGASYTLCLDQGRFRVQASWLRPDGGSRPGRAVPFGDDSGSFWFFDPNVIELDVKVLNACVPGLGNRFWVFAAGLTNVDVTLMVTDTLKGVTKSYHNPQGTIFQPITDTNAFATCP
jgi:hypothetical protein